MNREYGEHTECCIHRDQIARLTEQLEAEQRLNDQNFARAEAAEARAGQMRAALERIAICDQGFGETHREIARAALASTPKGPECPDCKGEGTVPAGYGLYAEQIACDNEIHAPSSIYPDTSREPETISVTSHTTVHLNAEPECEFCKGTAKIYVDGKLRPEPCYECIARLTEQLEAAQQETASVRAWAGDALQQWENKYEQFIRGHDGCKERAAAAEAQLSAAEQELERVWGLRDKAEARAEQMRAALEAMMHAAGDFAGDWALGPPDSLSDAFKLADAALASTPKEPEAELDVP